MNLLLVHFEATKYENREIYSHLTKMIFREINS